MKKITGFILLLVLVMCASCTNIYDEFIERNKHVCDENGGLKETHGYTNQGSKWTFYCNDGTVRWVDADNYLREKGIK